MQRKTFIKGTCSICLLAAADMLMPALAGCGTSKSTVYAPKTLDGAIIVPLALFETSKLREVKPKGWDYPIAVHQREDGTYHAMLMKCTHMDFGLNPISSGFMCHQHGSRFDKEGQVIKGPAQRQLIQYRTEVKGTDLLVYTS